MITSDPSIRRAKMAYKTITSKINTYNKRFINRYINRKGSLSKRSFQVLESQLGLIIIVIFSLVMNISIASAKNNSEDMAMAGNLTGLSPETIAQTAIAISKYTPILQADEEKIKYAIATQSDTYLGSADNFSTNITPPDEPVVTPAPSKRTATTNYTVQAGDTLSQIAAKFNLSLDTLKYTNSITNTDQLKLGQVLKIPVNDMSRSAIAKAQNQQASKKKSLAYAGRSTVGRDLPSSGQTKFKQPIYGYSMISQGYGRGHTGVDYATPVGTPIYAASDGVVIEAKTFGWNYGWGKTVLISHGGGVTSRYGHLSGLNVSVGDHVSQGEFIGRSGNTGHSTGPHLHFQKDINGQAVYPY